MLTQIYSFNTLIDLHLITFLIRQILISFDIDTSANYLVEIISFVLIYVELISRIVNIL